MERDRPDKVLDEWLDKATAEFGTAEPSPGFEQRMIAKVRAGVERRPVFYYWRLLALAAAIVVMIGAILGRYAIYDKKQTPNTSAGKPGIRLYRQEESPVRVEKAAVAPDVFSQSQASSAKPAGELAAKRDFAPAVKPQSWSQSRLLQAYVQAVASGEIAAIDDSANDRLIHISKVDEIPMTEISSIVVESLSIEPLPY